MTSYAIVFIVGFVIYITGVLTGKWIKKREENKKNLEENARLFKEMDELNKGF